MASASWSTPGGGRSSTRRLSRRTTRPSASCRRRATGWASRLRTKSIRFPRGSSSPRSTAARTEREGATGSTGSTRHTVASPRTGARSRTTTSSRGGSTVPTRGHRAHDRDSQRTRNGCRIAARLEGGPFRGTRKHPDADPRGVPDPRRGPRDRRPPGLREHRDGLRCGAPRGFPSLALVDGPRPPLRAPHPAAARMGDEPHLRGGGDGGDLLLRRYGLRLRGPHRIPPPAEGPLPREVRRPAHDDQRPPHGRVRSVDRLRGVVLPRPSARRELRDRPGSAGLVHPLPPPQFPHLRAPLRDDVPLPPGVRLARRTIRTRAGGLGRAALIREGTRSALASGAAPRVAGRALLPVTGWPGLAPRGSS